jgi:hypothetical protein
MKFSSDRLTDHSRLYGTDKRQYLIESHLLCFECSELGLIRSTLWELKIAIRNYIILGVLS